jgi:hypothetical protein
MRTLGVFASITFEFFSLFFTASSDVFLAQPDHDASLLISQ